MTEDDDDLIDLDEQIELVAKSLFTEKGPSYSKEVLAFTNQLMDSIKDTTDEEFGPAHQLCMAVGMINAVLVPILDNYGVEAAESLLQAMASQYRGYIEKAESMH